MIAENIRRIKQEAGQNVKLVVVSKFRKAGEIREAYSAGQRCFAENRVQDLLLRREELPADIEWHLIGHLQTNKVKQIVPFITLIQSVDSLKLLKEINLQASINQRVVDCLLQLHIAREETKFGLNYSESVVLLNSEEYRVMRNIKVRGLMGMASNTKDRAIIENEFKGLKLHFDRLKSESGNPDFNILSMGMSSDYAIAIACGSNMIRVGSAVFE